MTRARLAIRFGNRVLLQMKSVVPLLVDQQARTVTFAVPSAASAFDGKGAAAIETVELSLSASPATTVAVAGNRVTIRLR